ncbi:MULTISPECIES: hypothetical protein [Acinetobacter]|uniref:hypothetical protein n=1 Tax=Acinetobacter TaxID=469 RepID=UPI000235FA21|nr:MULTISPECIES: hypothetical protein [Acinetobacter]KXZ70230.1 hypothetical protein AVENLUH8758_01928 [Acinetobacter venetianus]GAB03216.1 hypothetical protein ACT4_053_00160 [Acinetobacter sp. NBRC 100985]
MEIDWKLVAPVVGSLVAIITLFFKLHEITSFKHKKISDRLASSIQYFDKYFEKGQTNQLVLDRAAQDLAKSPHVDHNLVNKLIEFHQNYLVNFDHMVSLFDGGYQFITYKKSQTLNIGSDLSIKPLLFLTPIWRRFLFVMGYFIFATSGAMLFLLLVSSEDVQFITALIMVVISLALMSLGFLFLMLEERIKHANNFVIKINEANAKYKAIDKPRTIILLSNRSKPS